MKRLILAALFAGVALMGLLLPLTTEAASPDGLPFPYYGGLTSPDQPLLPCTGFLNIAKVGDQDVSIGDVKAINGLPPCESLCNLTELFNRILWFGLSLMITIFLPFVVFVGGAMIFLGGGNPSRRAAGMKTIQGALIGIVFTLGAFIITNQLLLLVFNNGWGNELHAQALKQAAAIGISADKVPSFAWDNIQCSIVSGGIEVHADTPAPPTNNNKTCAGNGGACTTIGQTCGRGYAANSSLTCGGGQQCCAPIPGSGNDK